MNRFFVMSMPLAMALAIEPGLALAQGTNSTANTTQTTQNATSPRSTHMPYSPLMREHVRDFQRMMHNPFSKSILEIYILPAMNTKLNLSSSEASQLKQIKEQFIQQQQDRWKQISEKQASLRDLFKSGAPTSDQVKQLVTQIADLRAQQQYTSYDTATRMEGVLTADQLTQFKALTPQQTRQYAMAHLTIDEAVQMARLMRSSSPGYGTMRPGNTQQSMVRRGMMQQGMR